MMRKYVNFATWCKIMWNMQMDVVGCKMMWNDAKWCWNRAHTTVRRNHQKDDANSELDILSTINDAKWYYKWCKICTNYIKMCEIWKSMWNTKSRANWCGRLHLIQNDAKRKDHLMRNFAKWCEIMRNGHLNTVGCSLMEDDAKWCKTMQNAAGIERTQLVPQIGFLP